MTDQASRRRRISIVRNLVEWKRQQEVAKQRVFADFMRGVARKRHPPRRAMAPVAEDFRLAFAECAVAHVAAAGEVGLQSRSYICAGRSSMFYDTAKNDHGLPHNPFKACVVPRPIAWVSTLSHDGIVNLAPFSMFNQLGYDPPIVCFSGSCRPGTGQRKDSVTNAEETGEFVVNMATYALREQVSASARFVPPEVDEFEIAGVTKLPCRMIKPPRVAESPVNMECVYHSTLTVPANRRDTIHRVVIGRVVGIHIREDAMTDGRLDIAKIRPLARLGYTDYTSVTEVFSMTVQGTAAGQIGEAIAEKRKMAV
jgi:flavin reductase (DIM6/NTAB) family NADH-FMN oxidoreductase RutF